MSEPEREVAFSLGSGCLLIVCASIIAYALTSIADPLMTIVHLL